MDDSFTGERTDFGSYVTSLFAHLSRSPFSFDCYHVLEGCAARFRSVSHEGFGVLNVQRNLSTVGNLSAVESSRKRSTSV